MSLLRTLGIAVLALCLILTVAAANVVLVGHQTVLDPEFVTDTMEEEDAYEAFDETVTEMLLEGAEESATEDAPGEPGADEPPDLVARALDRAVTPAYIQSQVETNVYRTYEYLHGEREELVVSVSTEPLRERLVDAVEEEIRNEPTGTLLAEVDDGEVEEEHPIEPELIDRLEESPDGYETARAEFRDDVRESILDELVSGAFEERSNDELLALVVEDYDPDEYTEAEKERLVDERADEIEAALREELREEADLEAHTDDRLEELVAEAEADAPAEPSDLEEAGTALQSVVVRGLADEDLDYETYETEVTDAKATVGTFLGEELESEMAEELDDEIVLTEELDEDDEEALETARTAVGILDIAGIVLPLLAVVFVGLILLASRSIQTTAVTTGLSFLLVGVPSSILAWALEGPALDALPEPGDPAEATLIDLVAGFVTRILGTLQWQSLALVVLGAAVLAFGLAVRYDYVDLPTER